MQIRIARMVSFLYLFGSLVAVSLAAPQDGINANFTDGDEEVQQLNMRLANSLWLQHRVSDAWAALNQVPKTQRRLEWRLANAVFRGTSLTLLGHIKDVNCVAFSTDGSLIASGGADGRVILWDATTGHQIWSFVVQADHSLKRIVAGVFISPDSQRVLVTTLFGQLIQLDIANGSTQSSVQIEDMDFLHAQYCADGTEIALTGSPDTFFIVDAESGTVRHAIESDARPFLPRDNPTCPTAGPDGKLIAATKDNNIRIWDVDNRRWGRTFKGSDAIISKIRFSPNGKRLLAANKNQQILVWDCSNRRLIHKVQAPGDWFSNFAMNADGSRFATAGSDGCVRVWNATTAELISTFVGHSHAVHCLEFSPRGDQLVSAGVDGTLRIWNVEGSSLLEAVPSQRDEPILTISPNGQLAISRSKDDSLVVWEVESGVRRHVISELETSIEVVCFSPDGTLFAIGGSDGSLVLWDADTGICKWRIANSNKPILQIKFHPAGDALATWSEKGPVRLWKTIDGDLIAQLGGHGGRISDLAFRPDGKTFATSDSLGQILIWDWPNCQRRGALMTHQKSMRRIAYSPDGEFLATISQNTLTVWDVQSAQLRFTTGRQNRWLNQVTFADSGSRIVTIDDAGKITISSASDGTELFSFNSGWSRNLDFVGFPNDQWMLLHHRKMGWYRLPLSADSYFMPFLSHQGLVASVAIDPAGIQAISAGFDCTVRVWDVATGQLRHTLLGHRQPPRSVAISPDGKHGLSVADIEKAIVWDLGNGQLVREFHWRPNVEMTRVCSSPDGKTLYGRSSDNLIAWDPMSGRILKWLDFGSSFGNGLAISNDGTRLATVGESYSVDIFDTSDWSLQTSLPLATTFTNALAFDRSGHRIATAGEDISGEQTLKVWDVSTGLELMDLTDITAKIDAVCFSPDGTTLATGDQRGQITFRDLTTGSVAPYNAHGSWIAAVKFSPDGSLLASSSADGSVLLIDVNPVKKRHRFPGREMAMTGVDFNRDGTALAAVGPLNSLKVWDVITGAERYGAAEIREQVCDLAFCGDGNQVVAVGNFVPEPGDFSTVLRDVVPMVWDLESGKLTECLQLPTLASLDVRGGFSADGSKVWVRGGSGKSLTWETKSGSYLPGVEVPEYQWDANRSADGRVFVLPQNIDVGVYRLSPSRGFAPGER